MTEVDDKTDEDFIMDTQPTINNEYYYKKEDNRWYKSIYTTLKQHIGWGGRVESETIIMNNLDKPNALYVLKSDIQPLEYELSDKVISMVLDKRKDYYYRYSMDKYRRPIIRKAKIVNVINRGEHPRWEFQMSDNAVVEELYCEPDEFNNELSGGGGAKNATRKPENKNAALENREEIVAVKSFIHFSNINDLAKRMVYEGTRHCVTNLGFPLLNRR